MTTFSNRKPNGLVVDDIYEIYDVINMSLEDTYDFIYAPDAFTALKVIEKQNIDFILCDIDMPHVNGFDFHSLLNEKGYSIPLIYITGRSTSEYSNKALSLGAANFIKKPFEIDELSEKIEMVIFSSSSISEEDNQTKAHIINLLRSEYYDAESIFYQIKAQRISFNEVEKAIQEKQATGRCFLDELALLSSKKIAG